MPPRLSIRWWFLCKFAVVSVIVLMAVHFGHRAQVRRQAGALLRQADAARDATPANLLSHFAGLMSLESVSLIHGTAGLGHMLDEFSHAAKS